MNRCQRCNRELSDPYANYGWRCAAILGITNIADIGEDILRKLENGIEKADNLFKESNFNFTDKQWENLYHSFAKMSLWDGVDDKKVKEARKESYSAINDKRTKAEKIVDTLAEYYQSTIGKTPIHNDINEKNDNIWKTGALALDLAGYHLSSDLLKLAASGSGNKYIAKEGSYASELLKNDKGLNDFVKSEILKCAKDQKSPIVLIPDATYEIPLRNGDLGASLHNIDLYIDARKGRDGKWNAIVKVTDEFDFTEIVNPHEKATKTESLLWMANDIATASSKMGLLDPVNVEITYSKKY